MSLANITCAFSSIVIPGESVLNIFNCQNGKKKKKSPIQDYNAEACFESTSTNT